MALEPTNWSLTELQIYILLLCANADKEETPDEISFIQSKVSKETFDKIYKEFHGDSEKKRLKKVDRTIHQHHFSTMDLMNFRKEVFKIFFSDGEFKMMERRLDSILDNILY
jgi:hypothetical protein